MEGGLLLGVSLAPVCASSRKKGRESEMMEVTQWVKGIFNLHAVSRLGVRGADAPGCLLYLIYTRIKKID